MSRLWPSTTGSSKYGRRNCPENFENRAALVGAEIARIEGRELDAERLYETGHALGPAPTALFTMRRSPMNSPPAFYAAAWLSRRLPVCICRDARYGYLRWGADGKVRQTRTALYPHLRDAPIPASATATIGRARGAAGCRDGAQGPRRPVSGEIVLGELIKTLLRIAVEHGRRRAWPAHPVPGRRAHGSRRKATTGRGQVEVTLRQTAASPAELPESVLHYLIRDAGKSVILDDALAQKSVLGR